MPTFAMIYANTLTNNTNPNKYGKPGILLSRAFC